MCTAQQETVTRLLNGVALGEAGAAEALLPMVCDELRSLAEALFRDQKAGHALQPTALVHEAYKKLVGRADIQWNSRNQFFVLAAKPMRSILVDHARAKNRLKRGSGWQQVSIDVAEPAAEGKARGREVLDILALDEAVAELAERNERHARLVELRFFGGLDEANAAEVLGISRSTAAEEWRLARASLKLRLRGSG